MEKFNCTLIVDDDPISCFISEKIVAAAELTQQSFITHNGVEALTFIEENCTKSSTIEKCPGLIFLDLNMPVMDGFGFLHVFQNLNYKAKGNTEIIILTSSTNPVDIERVQGFDIRAYLNKPLTIESLQSLFS